MKHGNVENKMKNKNYHSVGLIPQYNRTIVETDKSHTIRHKYYDNYVFYSHVASTCMTS
jgi:hypothetical protein